MRFFELGICASLVLVWPCLFFKTQLDVAWFLPHAGWCHSRLLGHDQRIGTWLVSMVCLRREPDAIDEYWGCFKIVLVFVAMQSYGIAKA